MRIVRHACEAALFALGRCTIPFLPRRCIVGMARGLGGLAFRMAGGLRRIALANAEIVFGASRSETEKSDMVRRSFQNFALLALDLFWFSLFTGRRLRRWVRFDASCEQALSRRPSVLLSLHWGNWEVLGLTVAERGYTLHSVAAPLKNPFVNRQMSNLRTKTGLALVPQKGAVRALLQLLRKGERAALLMDQNTRIRDGGVFVEFFGLPATFSRAAAALAVRAQAPVSLFGCVPDADGGYRAFADAPIAPPAAAPGADLALTRELCRAMERRIAAYPDYWLWMYKRWKYAPVGADRTRFPFYVNPNEVSER